jgi:hypothetical protein
MDKIVLKAVCVFPKWFKQYEGLPFMVVFENYQRWRVCYAGHGISHGTAYRILLKLINDKKHVCTKNNNNS